MCQCAFRWSCPHLLPSLTAYRPCLPLLPPVPLLVSFSLSSWRQELCHSGTGAHKMSGKAGRSELIEGSLTAGACVGLQGSGRKQQEHSRWVRLQKHLGASEVECVMIRRG